MGQDARDRAFLKAAHIEPSDIPTWMDWRNTEIQEVRSHLNAALSVNEFQRSEADQKDKRMNMWKLAAAAGWFLAFLIGMEGRW